MLQIQKKIIKQNQNRSINILDQQWHLQRNIQEELLSIKTQAETNNYLQL